MPPDDLPALRRHARDAAQRAHVPFSGDKMGAALLLGDGTWVPGVRVESASFSLTIPATLNAFTTAVAAGRRDVAALALSRPFHPAEQAFWEHGPVASLLPASPHVLAATGAPPPQAPLDPLLPAPPPASAEDGVAEARAVAERALVPASGFPVGCALVLGNALVPGANVEPLAPGDPSGWMRVLCAERNALGTACSYGLLGDGTGGGPAPPLDETQHAAAGHASGETVLYLSCLRDAAGSPCGACRQLLVELLPGGVLWMDRAPTGAPERTSPSALLPGSFQGSALSRPDA